MVIAQARLTSKIQITIPAAVRKKLGLAPGDVVYLALEGERVVLRSLRRGWALGTAGLGEEVWRELGGAEAAIQNERRSWE